MRYAVLSAVVVAFAVWYARRHRAAVYHRHRYSNPKCHAQATLLHRARLAAQRVLSARIYITFSSNTRTAA